MEFKFDPIEEIVEEIRQGHIVIMQDPADRENEGDYICAAEFATPENINRMGIGSERLDLYAYGGGNCRCAVSCSDGSS